MVILGTRNKITDFLMILAWASPFKFDTFFKSVSAEKCVRLKARTLFFERVLYFERVL